MPNFRKSMVAGGATDVRTFDQGALLKKNKTLKPQGVCSPLALIWIKHQSKNTSFADAIRTDAGLEEVLFIERLKKSEKDFCKAYLTDYNLHAHFEQKLYPPMYNGLKRILVAGPGYYFVGGNEAVWANESVGGHAFAVDMFTNVFFDSNCGSAKFTTGQATAEGLIKWLGEGYPEYNMGVIQRFF